MPTSNAHIIVGPVIGKVTPHSARILVEFDREDAVVCTLQPDFGDIITCKIKSRANIPVVFSFNNLKPKTHYIVSINCTTQIPSSFWTVRENNDNPGTLNAAIISCNEIIHQHKKSKELDLWADLADRTQNHELDYIFHIGDQCYMDMGETEKTKQDPYQMCMSILKETPKDQWDIKKPLLLEILRDKCRRTWTHKSIADVLANVPNLTICDDHEFRDDWGFRQEDYTSGTPDWFYGQLARQVYYEYQRQLREDINWDNLQNLKCEYYDEIIHGVGISIMEYRGCRSWFREADLDETQMGKSQAAWIYDLYSEHGRFAHLNTTLFITPLPLFFLSHFYSQVAFLKEDDIQEHWTHHSIPQLASLLDLLREWKQKHEGRELTVIAGDVHVGGWTDIYHKNKPVLKQFVSSAINGTVPSKAEKMVLDLAQKSGQINEEYFVKHHDWVRENNFGLVRVREADGVSTVDTSLICMKKH